jgi:O-antigen ligase
MRTAHQLQFGGQPSRTNTHLAAIERGVVYVGVFLAPYATLRFSELFFTFSDFFFCLGLFLLLITGRIKNRPLEQTTSVWIFAFTLLFVGIMLGSLFNGSPQRGLIVMAQYLFAYMILMVILIREDPREAYRLAAIFLVSVVIIDAKRLATVLRNPNLAASINALTLPILLFFWSSGRVKSYLAAPALAIIIVTVVLTSSNSGLFTTALCLSIFIALISTPRLILRLALAMAIAVGGFALFGSTEMLPRTFQTRVLGALSSGDISEAGTFVSRAELMGEALHLISEERIAIVGIGADQFRERSVQDAPVHNLYLLLWVEGGLPALIGWMMFSGAGMLLGLAILKVGGDKRALAAVITPILVFLVIALFNPHMYARYWTIPLFLAFGLGLAELRRTVPPVAPRKNRSLPSG